MALTSPDWRLRRSGIINFDEAYGVNPFFDAKSSSGWLIRNYYWNSRLFKNDFFAKQVQNFWLYNHVHFQTIIKKAELYANFIAPVAENNFKRWPILKDKSEKLHQYPYTSYSEAINALTQWMTSRFDWIGENL